MSMMALPLAAERKRTINAVFNGAEIDENGRIVGNYQRPETLAERRKVNSGAEELRERKDFVTISSEARAAFMARRDPKAADASEEKEVLSTTGRIRLGEEAENASGLKAEGTSGAASSSGGGGVDSELQRRLEEAQKRLTEAQLKLSRALSEEQAAETEEAKAAAQVKVQAAQQEVSSAQAEVSELNTQLSKAGSAA